jgi:predicted transcriptional regulator
MATTTPVEIRLSPEQEAHLAALATSAGRSPDEIVQEAVALWEERENARALAEFRASLDKAEASLDAGKGRVITQESMRDLAEEVHQRGLARLAAEQKSSR